MPQRSRPSPLAGLDHPNAARLHELLTALQAGETLNADQAAASFGVSRRTVARDLKYLREDLGVDIAYQASTRSYRLSAPDELDLDGAPGHSTLAAFLVARHALAALGGRTDRGLLEATAQRLADALPETLRIDDLPYDGVAESSYDLAFAHIAALHRAIEQRQRVEIHTAAAPPRDLIPRALLSRQGRWWAVADAPDGFRFSPLVQVTRVRDLGPVRERPAPLDLDALLAEHPIICDEPDHRTFRIALDAGAAARCRAAPPPLQHRIVDHDQGANVYLCSGSTEETARWCLGVGEGLEAVDPELRSAIVRWAEQIAARHR